ncbi:hypothetical protein [Solidesulfovibrio sp.]
MSADPVEEETEYLNDEVENRMSFGMLAYGAKEPVKMRVYLDSTEVTSKAMESGPPCQAIGRNFNGIDATRTLELGPGHGQLHQLSDDNSAMAMELFVIYLGRLRKYCCVGRCAVPGLSTVMKEAF